MNAGLYGIQAARTYLDIHPAAKILVFEAADTVGGVWSSERNYKYFWTQLPIGMAEFSDSAMSPIEDKDRYRDLFPAKLVTEYLEQAVHFEQMAEQESDEELKARLLDQAKAYFKLAEKRARQLGLPIPQRPTKLS